MYLTYHISKGLFSQQQGCQFSSVICVSRNESFKTQHCWVFFQKWFNQQRHSVRQSDVINVLSGVPCGEGKTVFNGFNLWLMLKSWWCCIKTVHRNIKNEKCLNCACFLRAALGSVINQWTEESAAVWDHDLCITRSSFSSIHHHRCHLAPPTFETVRHNEWKLWFQPNLFDWPSYRDTQSTNHNTPHVEKIQYFSRCPCDKPHMRICKSSYIYCEHKHGEGRSAACSPAVKRRCWDDKQLQLAE